MGYPSGLSGSSYRTGVSTGLRPDDISVPADERVQYSTIDSRPGSCSIRERVDRRGFLSRASCRLAAAHPARIPRAASSASPGTRTTSKRDLVIAQAYDLTSLDPHASTLSSDWRVAHNVFDTLIRRHADATLHPALATTWKRTAPTTWRLADFPPIHRRNKPVPLPRQCLNEPWVVRRIP